MNKKVCSKIFTTNHCYVIVTNISKNCQIFPRICFVFMNSRGSVVTKNLSKAKLLLQSRGLRIPRLGLKMTEEWGKSPHLGLASTSKF